MKLSAITHVIHNADFKMFYNYVCSVIRCLKFNYIVLFRFVLNHICDFLDIET